ncbi:hypothetical protein CIB48_g3173 [Xylaria polymorpha]|nr:hypothetical protein CIB48_g3173 [Xylaria polymorpha]
MREGNTFSIENSTSLGIIQCRYDSIHIIAGILDFQFLEAMASPTALAMSRYFSFRMSVTDGFVPVGFGGSVTSNFVDGSEHRATQKRDHLITQGDLYQTSSDFFLNSETSLFREVASADAGRPLGAQFRTTNRYLNTLFATNPEEREGVWVKFRNLDSRINAE